MTVADKDLRRVLQHRFPPTCQSSIIFPTGATTRAAKRFLAKALWRSRDWKPRVINTDKNPAYGEAIIELKKEGLLPKDTRHRQVKYLNNRLESDHGKLKRLIKPMLGFQSMKTVVVAECPVAGRRVVILMQIAVGCRQPVGAMRRRRPAQLP